MAIESEWVRADMIEATEFPDLSNRYSVYAVPLTVVNDQVRFEGGAPEAHFVPQLLQQMGIGSAAPEP